MSGKDKLKILAVIPSGFCFGLQHITVDFFSRFPPSVESHFLLTKWGNGEMESLLKKNKLAYSFSWLGMFSRKMDWLNLKMSMISIGKLPKLYFDFYRLQKKFQPDIIYFANHHELILLSPVLALSKKRIVCHMHDPAPVIPFQKKTFKRYGRLVDQFIAISENVRQRTIALGCSPGKIVTIHNGIPLPALNTSQWQNEFIKKAAWPDNVFIVGITGQMTPTKGHLDLLTAFQQLHSKNSLARLVIGGKPEEPFYSELKKQVSDWKLDEVVLFTGWLPDVSVFFKSIHAFVLASRHDEGYGLVVAEAMANRLPVVITKSGGAVEIVEDGESGYIVPKADPKSMGEKLLLLSTDRGLCERLGENAREKISRDFDIQKQTGILVDCLFSVANS
jgi:glycosyltransferase involved in cell wall biosynthesis